MVQIDNKKMWELLAKFAPNRESLLWVNKCIEYQGYKLNDNFEIASIEPEPFVLEVGKWYECIKDFITGTTCRFRKGSFYLCEIYECLTDDQGFKYNSFGSDAAEYFRPATEEEISEAEYQRQDKGIEQALRESQRMTSAEAKEALYDKPDICKGCNNVKGCIACVNGSEWAHIRDPEFSHSKVTKVSAEAKEALYGKPDICKGCNNVKGCIACVNGNNWAHIADPELSHSEVTKESDQLTEFKEELYNCIGDYTENGYYIDNPKEFVELNAEKLFSIARKRLIEEACKYLCNHNRDMAKKYGGKATLSCIEFTIDIYDFRKALEKGGKDE